MLDGNVNLVSVFITLFIAAFIPLAVVTMTGFLKLSVVLFLVRNALGIQQTPPNFVLYSIALILAVYITSPLMNTTLTPPERAEGGYQFDRVATVCGRPGEGADQGTFGALRLSGRAAVLRGRHG